MELKLVIIEPGVFTYFNKDISYYNYYCNNWDVGRDVKYVGVTSLKYLDNLIENDNYEYTFMYYDGGNEERGYSGCLIRKLKGK